MGNGQWGVAKTTYCLPILYSSLTTPSLLFTHVIIRGQPGLKLIISCGHISGRFAAPRIWLSVYLLWS